MDVTDHVNVKIKPQQDIADAVNQFKNYICSEILADELELTDALNGEAEQIEIDEISTSIDIKKV